MVQPTCSSCGAAVRWVKTEGGKTMPLDQAPADNGNIVVRDDTTHYLKKGEEPLPGESRHVSHFATCVHAAKHRKA